ncbi:uncharacterized protein LOC141695577 [Apium graveolens]|uniref:uncharacterized protein LOC141695577 n=1 Tax=Apium graveolens TaxID=4045 RepID=UPI003D7A16A5
MDRSWMRDDRRTQEFKLGVEELLRFALEHGRDVNKISCPFVQYEHSKSWNARKVKEHLFQYGIDETYTCWIWHGENDREQSPITAEQTDSSQSVEQIPIETDGDDDASLDSSDLLNHLQSENEPLYPGCRGFTKMKSLVKLYNLKAKFEMSESCFSELLLVVGKMLPEGNCLHSSYGEAKKILSSFGMEYEKIHIFPNECLLYRGEINEDETSCHIFQASRWKKNKNGDEIEGIPVKVLWYFPLLPRLRNLFNSSKTEKDLTWHHTERVKDTKIRHLTGSKTWKGVDEKWPKFASDSRNLQIALSSDGFNHFHGKGTDHSSWPVLLSIYNLPPWLCMKRKNYGMESKCDAYTRESFVLRGILLWTISDYPALGSLSGNNVKGCNGCEGRKYFKQYNIYKAMSMVRHNENPGRKKEILDQFGRNFPYFILEYWKFLPVRHILDVMHIEKYIYEALLSTLLNIPKKIKDKESVRLDMAAMGIRLNLRPETAGKNVKLPLASWNLTHSEKKLFAHHF